MKMSDKIFLRGVVVRGLGIAGGSNPSQKFDHTISRQKKFFIEAGVTGIEKMRDATINIDIYPMKMRIDKPDHFVGDCEWWDGVKESFSFVKCKISLDRNPEKVYGALIYYPMPSEIKSHPDSIAEVISEDISGLAYGSEVILEVDAGKISVV